MREGTFVHFSSSMQPFTTIHPTTNHPTIQTAEPLFHSINPRASKPFNQPAISRVTHSPATSATASHHCSSPSFWPTQLFQPSLEPTHLIPPLSIPKLYFCPHYVASLYHLSQTFS